MYKKYFNIVFVLIFIVILSIPIITINTEKNRKLTSENRIAAQFPTVFDKDGKFMGGGTLTKGIEKWLNDNIGFRDKAGTIKTKVDWYVFDEYSDKRFFLGNNGWLSEGTINSINDYINYGLNDIDIKKYSSFYENIYDIAKNNNIPMVGMIIPDKKDIYPEYYSQNINRVNNLTLYDKVSSYINNYTKVPLINVKQSLLDNKNKAKLYSSIVDPEHWNLFGAFIGYDILFNKISEIYPSINKYDIGVYKIIGEDKYRKYRGLNLFEKYYIFKSTLPQMLFKKDNVWKNNINIPILNYMANKYVSNNKNAPKVLILGDSYLADSIIPLFFQDSFSEVTFIYNKNVMEQYVDNPKEMIQYYIDEFKPDLIIGQAVNRVLFEK